MDGFHADVAESMEQAGLMSSQRSPTGAIVAMSLSAKALQWQPVLSVGSPQLEFAMPRKVTCILQHTKLDLLLILHRQGFEHSEGALDFWSPATRDVYKLQTAVSGTKLYLVCLILREEIIARGAGRILHNGSARYYKLLLDLENLEPLKDCTEQGSENHSTILELSNKHELHKPLVDMAIANNIDHQGDDEGGEEDANFAASDISGSRSFLPVQLQTHASDLASYRCPVTNAYVHFDNCSHSSGLLRAYILCSTHSACTKHTQVCTQGSRLKAIAFCIAWNQWGRTLSKSEHSGRDKTPPPELVQEILERLEGDGDGAAAGQ
jgi:hypothetical protein